MTFDYLIHLFKDVLPQLLAATGTTLCLAAAGLLIGFTGGVFLGIFACDRIHLPFLKQCIKQFVSIVRGTPLFLQVLICYFAVPELIGMNLSPIAAGVMALGINSSAYVSEIVRGGINTINLGQWEAAKSLGYTKTGTLFHIILPQTLRAVLPPMTNELVTLLKETSVLMVIGVAELTKTGRDIVSRELNPLSIYLTVAVIYYALTTTISYGTGILEKRLKHD